MSMTLGSKWPPRFVTILILSTLIVNSSSGQQNDTTRSRYDTTFAIHIRPELSSVTVHYRLFDLEEDEQRFVVYDLTLSDSSTGKIIQSIKDTVDFFMLAEFEFIDVNFDGYLDLRLLSYLDAAVNHSFHYWLFDKRSKTFVFSREFSDLLVGETSWHPESKTIESTGRIGYDLYSTDIYSIKFGKLVLQERFQDDFDEINGKSGVVRKHFKLIKGVMKQVK